MTYVTVKIEAHCPGKQAHVLIEDDGGPSEVFTLADGETAERFVYGPRVITVREQDAPPP